MGVVGGWVGGWVAGLIKTNANLSKAELAWLWLSLAIEDVFFVIDIAGVHVDSFWLTDTTSDFF